MKTTQADKSELSQSGSETVWRVAVPWWLVSLFWLKTLHWLAINVLWLFTMTRCTNVIVAQSMLTVAVTYKPHSITLNKSQLILYILGHCRTTPNHRQEQLHHIMQILKKRQINSEDITINAGAETRHTGSQQCEIIGPHPIKPMTLDRVNYITETLWVTMSMTYEVIKMNDCGRDLHWARLCDRLMSLQGGFVGHYGLENAVTKSLFSWVEGNTPLNY